MTDAFVEQASHALAMVFAERGHMPVAIPQMADGFTALHQQFAALRSEVSRLGVVAQHNEQLVASLREELVDARSVAALLAKRLDHLEGRDGLVTAQALRDATSALADRGSMLALGDELQQARSRLQQCADAAEVRLLGETVVASRGNIEALTRRVDDDARAATDAAAAQQRLTSDRLGAVAASVGRLAATVDEHREEAAAAVARASNAAEGRHKALRDEMGKQLQLSLDEIVRHLVAQARVVDDMEADRRQRSALAPTGDEVAALRGEMEAIKRDIGQASFRVHEAYSHVMALAAGAGSSSSGAVATAAAPASPAPSQPRLPASVEVQVELLKRDMQRLLGVTMPAVASSAAAQRDQLDSVVAMHSRAQALLETLCECLGLADRGDELLACLGAGDRARATLLLQQCVTGIIGIATAAPTRAPSSSSAAAASVAPAGALTLGLEVADAIDLARARADGGSGATRLGAQVMSVAPGGVAHRSGLTPRDRIEAVNGIAVEGARSFLHAMRVAEAALALEARRGPPDTPRSFALSVASGGGGSGAAPEQRRTVQIPYGKRSVD